MHTTHTVRLPQALESWVANPGPMRAVDAASVDSHVLVGDTHYIGIRHQVLRNVTGRMLCWWNRFFCYQQLEDSHGICRPAFQVWHPRDHLSCEIERHSPSGVIGLARGATLTCREKYGANMPVTRTAEVLRLDHAAFHLSFRIYHHIYGLQMEEFRETQRGVELTTRLILETKGFIHEAGQRHNRDVVDALKKAWIRHKVEEIGNLERILPCMYSPIAVGWFGETAQ